MKLGISIKVDVTKIDKSRIFEGQKGKYLDLTTFIDTEKEDNYGNHGFISQSVTKQEKDDGVKTQILGNCKIFYGLQPGNKPDQGRRPEQRREGPPPMPDDDSDSIPF